MRGVAMTFVFALSVIQASNAAAAEERDEATRVTRLVVQQVSEQTRQDQELFKQQQQLQRTIADLVHSPEPDIARIKALRDEEQTLRAELRRITSEAEQRVLNSLSDHDYLIYLRTSAYPSPPSIRVVRNGAPAEPQPAGE